MDRASERPRRAITKNEVEQYEREGVVKLEQVFDLVWIDRLRAATELAMANPGPHAEEYGDGGGFFGDLDVARRILPFRDFLRHSPAAEIAAVVMASSCGHFFYDRLLVKEPGVTAPTPWHQDQPYWAVRGRQVASIWLPLDTIDQASSLRFVRGSHRWPAHNPHHFIDDSPYEGTGLPELPPIDAETHRYEILTWPLEPGDCLVFQAMIVHGAAGNHTTRRRRAWATRWTGDDARYDPRPGTAIPTRDPGIGPGDIMTCDDFPLLWKRRR